MHGYNAAQISTGGGEQRRWRRDGKELFYIDLDERLTAVPVTLDSERQNVDVGKPVPLFIAQISGATQDVNRQQYVVSPDSQRFLLSTVLQGTACIPITVLLSWRPKR